MYPESASHALLASSSGTNNCMVSMPGFFSTYPNLSKKRRRKRKEEKKEKKKIKESWKCSYFKWDSFSQEARHYHPLKIGLFLLLGGCIFSNRKYLTMIKFTLCFTH